ncbi:cytochrome P450 [Pluteus cervinus]|uniref:Cytochrome P450 n=1 Tax=Pluteus cervinus TaxID=181527 RepID=A0ACD3AQT9_9AGAR|nr:cytochrome P450 [Pluteus cervinus]
MSKKRRGIPPGPQGLPLLGNIFQLPPFMFLRFTEWKKQFGPLFSLNLAGQRVIVINSLKVATDLLEQRSSIYSDRPQFIVANEILSGQLMLPLVGYGSLWKKLRKASHEGFKSQTVPVYQHSQEIEAAILVENLINRPELWAEEIKRSTASSIKAIIYGTPPITSIDDPVVAFVSDMGHRLTTAVMPGAYLVELFPKMLYLPTWLAPWKREAMEWEQAVCLPTSMQRNVIGIKDNETDDRPSFAKQLCVTGGRHQLTQKEEAWLAGSIFVAGFDTSSSTLQFFILAMRLYPVVMKKAQTELDRVVGRERVPNISDRDDLPYVRAVVKELLRWGVALPAGVPRQTQQDDYYNGYFIPKGTLVMLPPFMFLRFTEWKKQFGPLFSLNLAGQLVIVINSLEVATDLLEQRSSIYSDRPRFIVAGELLTRQLVLPLVGYGSFWKKLRKASHEPLKSQTVPMYHRPQEIEAAILVENLINRPELWAAEIKRSTASSIKAVIYGTPPIASIDDPVVAFISEMGHRFSTAVMPGAYLVELFPTMLYLPAWLAPWKREAMEWEQAVCLPTTMQLNLTGIKDDGTDDRPSFAKQLYIAGDRHQLVLKEEAWLAGSMFVAGFDTSYASLEFFVLAMRLYPDVMKKAQAELDRVVGRGRVPSVSDSDDLPYVRALVKEVLRWGTPMPIGVPRRTQQDDYYNERYLDATGTMDVDIPGTHNQGHVSFGFGRRLCVGMNLAVQSLFINVATLLWAANVEPAYDQNGQIITPTNTPTGWVDEGGVIRPAPFRCHIVPRFDGGEAMLRRAREQGCS